MARIRTFIALHVSQAVRASAGDLIEQLRDCPASVKWVAPEHMHLTLKFLGDVPEQELADVCRVVGEVCDETGAFEIQYGGAGAFPNLGRPRTVWLGVQEGAEPLEKLQKKIERALRDLGFRRERRRYHGHLTLGRVRGGGPEQGELGELLRGYGDFRTPRMLAEEVRVYASYLDKEGPTHEVLASCPLEG